MPTPIRGQICWLNASLDNSADDLSGEGNDATLTNVSIVSSSGSGGSKAFDLGFSSGVSRAITLPDIRSDFSTEASFSIWIKRNSHTPDIVDKSSCWSGNGYYNNHYPYTDGNIYDGTFLPSVSYTRRTVGSGSIANRAAWHHVCITRSNAAWKYYQNGSLVSSQTSPGTLRFPAAFRVGFDVSSGSPINYSDFLCDDLRWANVAWTASEIANLTSSRIYEPVSIPPVESLTEVPSVSPTRNRTAVAVDIESLTETSLGEATRGRTAGIDSVESLTGVPSVSPTRNRTAVSVDVESLTETSLGEATRGRAAEIDSVESLTEVSSGSWSRNRTAAITPVESLTEVPAINSLPSLDAVFLPVESLTEVSAGLPTRNRLASIPAIETLTEIPAITATKNSFQSHRTLFHQGGLFRDRRINAIFS